MLLHKNFSGKISTIFLPKKIIVIAPATMKNRLAIVYVKRTHYGVGFGREGQTDRQRLGWRQWETDEMMSEIETADPE